MEVHRRRSPRDRVTERACAEQVLAPRAVVGDREVGRQLQTEVLLAGQTRDRLGERCHGPLRNEAAAVLDQFEVQHRRLTRFREYPLAERASNEVGHACQRRYRDQRSVCQGRGGCAWRKVVCRDHGGSLAS